MKIIQPGKERHMADKCVGMKLQCPHCDCVWEIEKGDNVFNHDGMASMQCPHCREHNYVFSSRILKNVRPMRERDKE